MRREKGSGGMLVLSRQKDESIVIGDDIEITVVDIRGDKVRLGISAPNEIPVHRKEVYEAIQRENVQAARVKPGDVDQGIANRKKAPRGHSHHPDYNFALVHGWGHPEYTLI